MRTRYLKQTAAFFLSTALLLNHCPLMVLAQNAAIRENTFSAVFMNDLSGSIENSNLSWMLTADGTLIVFGTGELPDFDHWTLPPWQEHLLQIESILVDEGVTALGESAFEGCSNVKSVSLPSTLAEIGAYCFKDCENLITAELPEGITVIPEKAFSGCYALEAVKIPQTTVSIGDNAFYDCESLQVAILPENLKVLGAGVFQNCLSLQEIIIPERVGRIEARTFMGCDALKEVILPKELVYLGDYACSATVITEIELPDTLETIGNYAFYWCKDLTKIRIPDSVLNIWENAFGGCDALKEIIFDGSVPGIHNTAFNGVTADAYYPENNVSWTEETCLSYGGTLTWRPYLSEAEGEEPKETIASGAVTEHLSWILSGEGVLTITGKGEMPDFNHDTPSPWKDHLLQIKTIIIEEGVTSLGESSFEGCCNAESVVLPDTLTALDSYCFQNCESLKSIVLPAGITSIPANSFSGCSALTAVEIPNTVTLIEDNAFASCEMLGTITLSDNLTALGAAAFENCTSLCEVVIPDTITEITERTFYGCEKLASVTLPSELISVGEYAFSSTAVAELDFPETLETIGSYAFYWCQNLTNIQIPDSVKDIYAYAFGSCSVLKEITFCGGAMGIHNTAFACVTADAYYPENYPSWTEKMRQDYGGELTWKLYDNGSSEEQTDPSAIVDSGELNDSLFWKLTADGTLTISGEGAMENFDHWNGPPWQEYQLLIQKIIVEEGVAVLGESAFENCSKAEAVILPDSLSTIGAYCFQGCESLTEIRFGGDAPDIHSSAFGGVTADVYYSGDYPSWTESKLLDYGGALTWCDITAKDVAVQVFGNIDYTVDGQVVTVDHKSACKVGYLDGERYAAIDVVKNADGTYCFTVPEGVGEVVLVASGDIDGATEVNSADKLLIARSLLLKSHPAYKSLNPIEVFAADINNDGTVNSADKLLLARSLLLKSHPAYQELEW